jgi:hypothetical protein
MAKPFLLFPSFDFTLLFVSAVSFRYSDVFRPSTAYKPIAVFHASALSLPPGTPIFIPVVEHILLEETHKVFEKFKAVLSQFIAELATDDDNAPVGVVAHALYLQLIYYADDIVRLGTEIYWLNKKVCF